MLFDIMLLLSLLLLLLLNSAKTPILLHFPNQEGKLFSK